MMTQVGGTEGPTLVTSERDEAIHALYEREFRSLVGLAALLVDERGAAEDVVQDAFVKLYRSWNRVADSNKAPAYLRSAVLNTARSALRHRRVVRVKQPLPDPPPPSADEAAVTHEEQRELMDALAELPRRCREVTVLRYYGELSEAEIAEALGISKGSVKSYAHRGLQLLGERLEVSR